MKWGKNAFFLVVLGIYYFYGVLDRQQRVFFVVVFFKAVVFLLSRKQAVLVFKAPLVSLVKTLLRIDGHVQFLAEFTWRPF